MRHRSAWWLTTWFLLSAPVSAQLAADPAAFVVLGLVSAKQACVKAHPDLAHTLGAAYEALVARSESVLSREQWLLIDGLLSTPSTHTPSHEDCARLVQELRTVDINALAGRARAGASCMQEVRAASERAGATRPAIGVSCGRLGRRSHWIRTSKQSRECGRFGAGRLDCRVCGPPYRLRLSPCSRRSYVQGR